MGVDNAEPSLKHYKFWNSPLIKDYGSESALMLHNKIQNELHIQLLIEVEGHDEFYARRVLEAGEVVVDPFEIQDKMSPQLWINTLVLFFDSSFDDITKWDKAIFVFGYLFRMSGIPQNSLSEILNNPSVKQNLMILQAVIQDSNTRLALVKSAAREEYGFYTSAENLANLVALVATIQAS